MSIVRSALITGASRGIGAGIARALASRRYGLTLAARDESRLNDVADELRALGAPEVLVVAGDAAAEGHVSELTSAHATAFGAMDCLVLNAGVGTAGSIEQFPMGRLDRTLAVNLRAPFELLQGSLPLLRAAATSSSEGGARVIAMSSITGAFAEPGLAAYGATKAALMSMIETFNAEESGSGVSGTAIAPGYVDTDMSGWVKDRIDAEQMILVEDIVRLVLGLLDFSARSVVSKIVVHRAGTSGYVA